MANAATVRHVNKNLVLIAPAEGYTVTIFNITDGKHIEAFVVSDDGEESFRIRLEGPDASHGVKIKYFDDSRETQIEYVEKPSI